MNLEIALQGIEENESIDIKEKLENLQRKVTEKDEQVQEVKSFSKALSLRVDKNNVELQDARLEIINGLEMDPYLGDINIKPMGMLDSSSILPKQQRRMQSSSSWYANISRIQTGIPSQVDWTKRKLLMKKMRGWLL